MQHFYQKNQIFKGEHDVTRWLRRNVFGSFYGVCRLSVFYYPTAVNRNKMNGELRLAH